MNPLHVIVCRWFGFDYYVHACISVRNFADKKGYGGGGRGGGGYDRGETLYHLSVNLCVLCCYCSV